MQFYAIFVDPPPKHRGGASVGFGERLSCDACPNFLWVDADLS
jgi:hypothetical protein